MNGEDELRRLAGALGVPATYRDASGRMRDVPAASLRAVCGTLGFDAQDDAAVGRSLERFPRAQSEQFLPPVIAVSGTESPIDIPLNVPQSAVDRPLEWEVREESGRTHVGEGRAQDLLPAAGAPGRCLRLAPDLPAGYHVLRVRMTGDVPIDATARLILAPLRAYQPPTLDSGTRVWALSTQLYALRSATNWGIGDFTDLADVMECAGRCGAAGVGINPLHSLFADDPERASPYSPSSRLFLNPIYLDPTAIEDFEASEEVLTLVSSHEFLSALERVRGTDVVDYSGASALKQRALGLLYAHFRRRHLDDPNDHRGLAFRAFQASGGITLRQFAVFEALREELGANEPEMRDWRRWPPELRTPDSSAVSAFANQNLARVEFFEYLQWQADRQLMRTADRAARAALPIGLYRDLAIGVDSAGADAWAHQDVIVGGFSVGAPPDAWAPGGQNWGFPPLHPVALRRSGYRMFIDVLRANMRGAGALRIDHVLGLMRTFWIPDGCAAADGAYVHSPFDELLAIVVLESHRNKCLVIGEDLGTLPEGLRDALQAAGLYSYRLLYFERAADGRFLRPDEYPVEAVAAVSTHDLPTVVGYWRGHDIDLRQQVRDTPSLEEANRAHEERARDRSLMLAALRGACVAEIDPDSPDPPVAAIHRFLALSRSRLVLVQIEDLVRQVEQMNLPGTDRELPNWRRKLPATLTEIFADAGVHDVLAVIGAERPLPVSMELLPRREAPPDATYRVQLNSQFGFADLQRVLAYLCELGISHVYVSPFLRARPGSSHGYDVIDHGAINPEIGDERALDRLCAALRALDMGMILDFVPNHVGVGHADNEWWFDVLQWGSSSPYAAFFDIDWQSPKHELTGKVLLPFLGDHYGAVLERGELQLAFEQAAGSFSVRYFDGRFPLRPRHYALLLRRALEAGAPAGDEALASRLRKLADSFSELRPEGQSRPRQREIWNRGMALKEELSEVAKNTAVPGWIDRATTALNGTPGHAATFRPLHRLLERQAYRLAFWRVAADEINYRRFFDISDLVGIRQEVPALFQQSHRLIGRLIAEDKIHGLRIDHIDGLFDPAGYCRQLRDFARAAVPQERGPFYVVVEKILAADEHLRRDWAVSGTTGYDFLGEVNRLFMAPGGESVLDETYSQFTGDGRTFDRHALECRHLVMEAILSSELNVLARALDRISEQHWLTRDYTIERLRHALKEITARFAVYRTYVTRSGCSAEDRHHISTAVERAGRSWTGPDRQILDFVSAALMGDLVKDRSSGFNRNDVLRFAMRFQQYTAPVMAKAVEDTAYYRYGRLLSLNEVGCAPQPFALSPADFHQANLERLRSWPHTLLATATHDTKRGEDMRVRLNLLSEMPHLWAEAVQRWRRCNRSLRSDVGGRRAPSRADEYILYQTLVGAWPTELVNDGRAWPSGLGEFRARIKHYLVKAVREAKTISSWTDPDEFYEKGCLAFVDAVLDENGDNAFLGDCRAFVRHIAFAAALSSLSQTVLKCFSPGVPDIYQGSEFWDLSLVDPDNRRAVDFDARRSVLAALSRGTAGQGFCEPTSVRLLLRDWPDGQVKLHVLRRALQLRNARPSLFANGAYEPLTVRGERSRHVVAFRRRHGSDVAVIAVGRLFAGLQVRDEDPTALDWRDSVLHVDYLGQADLVDAFTGRRIVAETDGTSAAIPLQSLFETLPVAALTPLPTGPLPHHRRSASPP